VEARPTSVVEGALQCLCFGARAPVLLERLGPTIVSRRSPCPPRRAWRNPWRESATRQSFGETSYPGGRSPSMHPRGAADTAAEAITKQRPEVGRHRGAAAKTLARNRQFLASGAYAAPRRVTIESPPQGWRTALTRPGNLSRPPAGGRRIRHLYPLPLRRTDAARGLRSNPGFERPVRTGVGGPTRRWRRLVCMTHCSDQLPGATGPIPSSLPARTKRTGNPVCLTSRGMTKRPIR
jgi:hypothetical protein